MRETTGKQRFILLHDAESKDVQYVLRVKHVVFVSGDASGSVVECQRGEKTESYLIRETPHDVLALINGESTEPEAE